jgi:arylsulfatase A
MKKLKSAITFIMLGLWVCGCKPTNNQNKSISILPTSKPNIIYILADDMGIGDLGVYGQKLIKTPNLDTMASEGMRFTEHYTGSTVCAPSRCSLLTGKHTGNSVVRGNKEVRPEGQQPMPAHTITIGHKLKEAGYTTAAVGKWGLGAPGSVSDPLNMGFDYFFGYNCQRQAHTYFPNFMRENDMKIEYPENYDGKQGIYSHDETTKKAFEFIQKNRAAPFFLYLAYAIPHAEMVIPQEYLSKFKGKYPETPFKGQKSKEEYQGAYGAQTHPRAAYEAMISHLDGDIGKLNALLKDLGIDENTVVLFASDNGPHIEGGNDPEFFDSNSIYKGVKRSLYDGGIRTPFIVKWPNKVAKGAVSNHISAFWDMMPTLCEIAGVEIPDNINGISLLPELLQKEQKQHAYLYWEFHGGNYKQAIRQGDWKAVRLKIKTKDTPIELYNLKNDPSEENNIALLNIEKVNEMKLLFDEAHKTSAVFQFPYEKNLK